MGASVRVKVMKQDATKSDRAVAAVCAAIESWIGQEREGLPPLKALAEAAGLSPAHLQKIFTARVGVSPRAWGEALRRKEFKRALKGGAPVADAVYAAGYGSPSRVYEQANAWLGMTPASYARGGQGAEMRYSFGHHRALGIVMIAATAKGLSAVMMGANEEDLLHDLRKEYPLAALHPDDGALRPWLDAVLEGYDHPERWRKLPLDVWGTAFQARVWAALRALPPGTAISYGEIAARIGAPKAVRGVGQACARNKVALVIPCHRALAKDGKLHGYRWGLERKERILAQEKAAAEDDAQQN